MVFMCQVSSTLHGINNIYPSWCFNKYESTWNITILNIRIQLQEKEDARRITKQKESWRNKESGRSQTVSNYLRYLTFLFNCPISDVVAIIFKWIHILPSCGRPFLVHVLRTLASMCDRCKLRKIDFLWIIIILISHWKPSLHNIEWRCSTIKM